MIFLNLKKKLKKIIHLSLELVGGEKAKKSGKNTIRIKGQDSKPRSLKKSGQKPDTEQVQRPTGGRQFRPRDWT